MTARTSQRAAPFTIPAPLFLYSENKKNYNKRAKKVISFFLAIIWSVAASNLLWVLPSGICILLSLYTTCTHAQHRLAGLLSKMMEPHGIRNEHRGVGARALSPIYIYTVNKSRHLFSFLLFLYLFLLYTLVNIYLAVTKP